MQGTWGPSLSLEDALKEEGQPTPTPGLQECLGNPMDRGAWWSRLHKAAKSGTQLSMFAAVLGAET